MGLVLVPGEIGGQLDRPYLTVDGFKQLIADLTEAYGRKPTAIILSEYDRRELNQQVMAGATQDVAKEDQRPEGDGKAIGYIEGVAFVSERGMSRGNCRPVFGAQQVQVENRLGGEGKIIVGA
jgi:hypothetical protein